MTWLQWWSIMMKSWNTSCQWSAPSLPHRWVWNTHTHLTTSHHCPCFCLLKKKTGLVVSYGTSVWHGSRSDSAKHAMVWLHCGNLQTLRPEEEMIKGEKRIKGRGSNPALHWAAGGRETCLLNRSWLNFQNFVWRNPYKEQMSNF